MTSTLVSRTGFAVVVAVVGSCAFGDQKEQARSKSKLLLARVGAIGSRGLGWLAEVGIESENSLPRGLLADESLRSALRSQAASALSPDGRTIRGALADTADGRSLLTYVVRCAIADG